MNAIARLRPVWRRASFSAASIASAPLLVKKTFFCPARRQRRQPLGQPDLRRVVKVGARHVDQAARLPADRRHDLGMRVPDVGHRDPGGEVEEAVAVHVLDHRARGPAHHQRIRARVRRRHHPISRASHAALRGPGNGPTIRGSSRFSRSHSFSLRASLNEMSVPSGLIWSAYPRPPFIIMRKIRILVKSFRPTARARL